MLIYSTADFLKWRVMLERNGEFTDARLLLLLHRALGTPRASVAAIGISIGYFGETYAKRIAARATTASTSSRPSPIRLCSRAQDPVVRGARRQRFGAAHVTNVLRGSESDQVSARRHDQLTTFGLLKEMSVPEVRGYIEQLSGNGLLRQTDWSSPCWN